MVIDFKTSNISSNKKFLVATLLLGILIIFFVIKVSNVDFDQLKDQISRSDFKLLILAGMVYYAGFLPRGLRFLLITDLYPSNKKQTSKLLKSSFFILIGWFINSITLLRAGDLYRVWLFNKEYNVKLVNLIGFLIAERLQDLIIIILLLLTVLILAISQTQIPFWIVFICLIISSLMIITLLLGVTSSNLIKYIPLNRKLDSTSFENSVYKSFKSKKIILQLIIGIFAWLCEIFRLAIVLMALEIELSLALIILVTILGTILTTVPLPGGLGIVEGGLIGVLIILGFDSTTAVSITIIDRSITWFSILVTGSISFIIWNTLQKTTIRNFFPYKYQNNPEEKD